MRAWVAGAVTISAMRPRLPRITEYGAKLEAQRFQTDGLAIHVHMLPVAAITFQFDRLPAAMKGSAPKLKSRIQPPT